MCAVKMVDLMDWWNNSY